MNSWKFDCVDCTTQTTLFNTRINQNPPRTLMRNFHAKVLPKALFKTWNSSSVFHILEVTWPFKHQCCHSHTSGAQYHSLYWLELSPRLGSSAQWPTMSPAQSAAFSSCGQHSAAVTRVWLWSMLSPPLPGGKSFQRCSQQRKVRKSWEQVTLVSTGSISKINLCRDKSPEIFLWRILCFSVNPTVNPTETIGFILLPFSPWLSLSMYIKINW